MSLLFPFKGRNVSGDSTDNLLYQEKNIYIMDNHRLALWCWFQQIKPNETYNLFHIDAHPDMAKTANIIFEKQNINMWEAKLETYQGIMQPEYNIPLFRWDNYIQILLNFYPQVVNIENTYSATHKVGSIEELTHELSSYRLLAEMLGVFNCKKYINENKWIVNLDLDYFFSAQPEKLLIFSEEYLETMATVLDSGLKNGMIKVLTIALSPECCGGWEKSEKVLSIFTKKLNIQSGISIEN